MAELHTRNGNLGTEIADHAGELHDYVLRRLSARVYEVLRENTGDAYTLILCGHTWSCNCPAFKFRHARNRVHLRGTCKHVQCIREVHPVLQTIQGASA